MAWGQRSWKLPVDRFRRLKVSVRVKRVPTEGFTQRLKLPAKSF